MQKYLLDENLSNKLSGKLSPVLHDVMHVCDAGLLNSFDKEIWDFAKANNYVIITKDYDFSDMSHLHGCPPKVIKLNCGNKTTGYISDTLIGKKELIHQFVN